MQELNSMQVTRLASALGAEVRNINLGTLKPDQAKVILALLLEHKVLFFPGQNLTIDEHVAFGELFGDLEGHPHKINPFTGHNKVFELAASHGGIADEWHSDITFRPNPALFSILNMVKCPSIGGDTLWANPELAYEGLSAPLRELCDGLTALHNAEPHGRSDVMTIHPVVRSHPDTGRKGLFVNEHFTRRIVELSHVESSLLLNHLTNWVASLQFTVRYSWTQGTIAMWDNRCTQHKVLNDFKEERLIQRVTVMGDRIESGKPKWDPFVRAGHASDTSRFDKLLLDYLSQQKLPSQS
jgi:taurine dioxygenase